MATGTTAIELGWERPVERGRAARFSRMTWRFARRKPLGFFGLLLVVTFVFVAIFAEVLAPYEPSKLDLRHRLEGPSSSHLLGTDNIGRDTLSRLMFGARISLQVGFGAVIITTTGAAILGMVSGYAGGWLDKILQRIVDAWQAMPGLIILITLLGIVRRMENVNLVLAMVLSIGLLSIAGSSRVVRSATLAIKAQPFVEAARSLGAGAPRIILTCLLPNVFPLLLVNATIALGGVILAEASLSFLGFGPAGQPSWGQMLSVEGREFMRKQIGLALWPGLCIAAAVFGFNMFGDALRDVVDPRLRGR